MNILFAKLGRSISFNKEKWSAVGGDIEAPTLLIHLAKLHPEDNFYIMTSSDIQKNELLKQKLPNVFDLYTGFNFTWDDHTYLIEKIKRMNLKFDYAIIYNGITGGMHFNMDYLNAKGEMVPNKPLSFMQRYCSPQIFALNELKVRWCLLSPDPRYYPLLAKDIYSAPEVNYAEYESVDDWKARVYATREKYVVAQVPSVYNEIDTVCLMGKRKPLFDHYIKPRSEKLNLILNEGGKQGSKGRGPALKEYVLDTFPEEDIKIYGKWEDKWYEDKRFKGPEKMDNLVKMLINTRYTFIIPTDVNWASSKFCEMVYFGIIPFMHPTYDTQKLIKCPEFVRCSSPRDFYERVQFLEDNPEERIGLLKELYDMYGPEYFDGTKVINSIYEQIANPKY